MKPTSESPDSGSNAMKQLFIEYHQSHINRTNQLIHYICVPAIFWSISALLWLIKIPLILNAAMFAVGLLMLYYLLRSIKVFLVMLPFSAACLALNYWFESLGVHLLYLSTTVFIIAWIGQFIGHYIEGKKPSFFQDLQFLLIGPAWVVFKCFGIKV